MYRLIRGIKEDLFRVRPSHGGHRSASPLQAQVLYRSCREPRHPAETCTVGLGFALLSKQAT